MGQVVSVVVAGAVGVQEWYFVGYVSGCDGRNMLTHQNCEKLLFFAENADISAQKSVFLLQIYGSLEIGDIK